MSSNKVKYRELCKTEDIPLFSQYYWMDAVCGADNWDVIIIEKKGKPLGTLVYYLNSIDDGYEIRKALLTQNNGIIFYYPEGIKYDRMLSFEYKVTDAIIDKLEELNIKRFRQYFHYNFTNWLPFYWRGYLQTTRYTYVIENTSSLERLYNGFNGNIRNYIRKAEKIVSVEKGMSSREFYDLNEKTYMRQGIDIPYSFELFNKLYENLVENECLEIFYALDESENIHSAALFAYDTTSVYYLMSGSVEEFRDSQSLTLLIYEGIKLANKLGKSFDFEGSMKKNIERFFRQFGAEQKQYFDISKEL
jgi:lipid II:glycine glycyltransferase (peptidoglycan interpeptide bridge formation enzyme)